MKKLIILSFSLVSVLCLSFYLYAKKVYANLDDYITYKIGDVKLINSATSSIYNLISTGVEKIPLTIKVIVNNKSLLFAQFKNTSVKVIYNGKLIAYSNIPDSIFIRPFSVKEIDLLAEIQADAAIKNPLYQLITYGKIKDVNIELTTTIFGITKKFNYVQDFTI